MLLAQKKVSDIEGTFHIEAYQRGYRWSEDEIVHLLEDINEIPESAAYTKQTQTYCLQPIVVKKFDNYYELIDGQQRLTTLYLIMKYLKDTIDIKYSIEYVTRNNSKQMLEQIDSCDLNATSKNIDELFIKSAYSIIKKWFHDDKQRKIRFTNMLQDKVTVIWYEVDEDENGVNIFTRLNIGKINLTNAELVKALFLSSNDTIEGIDNNIQHEIALEWDRMEKDLHDKKFWSFITNEKGEKYPIRMEMLFDMIENKPSNDNNFYTFNSFYEKFKNSQNKYNSWETIVRYYQQLQEWYRDFDLFHHIGFLVAEGESLKHLLDMALNDAHPMLKSQFRKEVLNMIRNKMVFVKDKGKQTEEVIDYADLNYEEHSSYIHTLLLLFNIETIRQKGDEDNRFPFERYKSQGKWSLEHIHAQNSESLNNNEQWNNWLKDHKKSLENIKDDPFFDKSDSNIETIIGQINEVISHIETKNYKGSIRNEFNLVAPKVIQYLSDGNDTFQTHSIANMALLTICENAALNNSTFDVKREKIIQMDKNGDYIPICTRNVFMKYYSNANTKLHFWSENDRQFYIQAMNQVLYYNVKLIKNEIKYGNKQQH